MVSGISLDQIDLVAFFFNELILGSYLGKILPIFCTFYILNKDYLSRYFVFVLILLIYVLIFLTGERSAFFTTTLYMIMISPFLIGIKRTTILFILIGTIFAIIISTNKNIKSRYVDQMLMHTFGVATKATVFMPDHIGLFSSAIDIFQKNIFFGGGVKTFRINCKNTHIEKLIKLQTPYPNIVFCSTHPHNYYLQLLAETGLIGFLFILAIFIKLFFNYLKQIYNLLKKDKKVSNEYVTILSGIIIYIWPLTTTGSFFNNWICSILFLQIGIYLYIRNEYKN